MLERKQISNKIRTYILTQCAPWENFPPKNSGAFIKSMDQEFEKERGTASKACIFNPNGQSVAPLPQMLPGQACKVQPNESLCISKKEAMRSRREAGFPIGLRIPLSREG